MLPGDVLFLAGLVVVDALTLCACLTVRRLTWSSRLVAVVAVQGILVFTLLAGGYWESRVELYSDVRSMVRNSSAPPAEHIEIRGDPALVKLVQGQRPSRSRPTGGAAFRDWQQATRHDLVSDVLKLSLPLGRTPAIVHEQRVVTLPDGVRRILITFESSDGTTIPAYIFVPPGGGAGPAIIVLHGHLPRQDHEGISQTGGLVDSYQHGAALELARAGFVTLTLEFRGFGYLGPRIGVSRQTVEYNALLAGASYKAVIARDIASAIEVLSDWPGVDPTRIGMTGVSFGGEMAVTYAALDERMKVVVFQGFGGSVGLQPPITDIADLPNYTHLIPGQNAYLLQEDLFMLVAPRPLLGVRGSRDFPVNPEFARVVAAAYAMQGAASAFDFVKITGGHEYFVEPARDFFRRHL